MESSENEDNSYNTHESCTGPRGPSGVLSVTPFLEPFCSREARRTAPDSVPRLVTLAGVRHQDEREAQRTGERLTPSKITPTHSVVGAGKL